MDGSRTDGQAPAQPASPETPSQPTELTIIALKPTASENASAALEFPAPPAVALTTANVAATTEPDAPAEAISEPATVQPALAPMAMAAAHKVIDDLNRAEAPPAPETKAAPLARPRLFARIPSFALRADQIRRAAWAGGGVAAALAAGWAGAALIAPAAPAKPDPLAAQTAMRVEQLSTDIRGVRDAVATLSKGRSRGGDDLKPLQERVSALGEAIEKLRADQSTKIAGLAGSADRGEKADRDIAGKMAQIVERLDRIERASAPQITGSISPQPQAQPQQTAAAQPIPTPPPRPVATEKPATPPAPKPLAGWTLRDIYDGLALIENRQAGIIEVAPGQIVRGLGRIEKIEQRGGRWVVVTQQGVIASN